MDTTHLEYTAEDLISHKLMAAGILVAKPKFDRQGTDLLAFIEMADGVKFCRIQCKGRTLTSSDSNIAIPIDYVTNAFVVFLYVEDGNESSELFCFLASDIRSWSQASVNGVEHYRLSLTKSNFRTKLSHCRFDPSKLELIRMLIEQAQISGEFKYLIYGKINATLGDVSASFRGTVKPPST